MDLKRASQVAQVALAVPVVIGALWYVYVNTAKVDDLGKKACISEARADLNGMRLLAIQSYLRFVHRRVDGFDAQDDPTRRLYDDAFAKFQEASLLAKRIEAAKRAATKQKDCNEIVMGLASEPEEGGS